MKRIEIRADLIETVAHVDGSRPDRLVMRTVGPGTVEVVTKDGDRLAHYHAGAVTVADAASMVPIVGPVDFDSVLSTARSVLAGDQQASTHPGTLTLLAAAIIGFSGNAQEPIAAEAALQFDETAEGDKPERASEPMRGAVRSEAAGDSVRTV